MANCTGTFFGILGAKQNGENKGKELEFIKCTRVVQWEVSKSNTNVSFPRFCHEIDEINITTRFRDN